jgi:hypothetical protein
MRRQDGPGRDKRDAPADRFHRLAGLALLLPLVLTSCNGTASSPQPSNRPLVVLVSCDTAGWIVPCGCSSKQAGGLLRRATYAQQIAKSADILLADAGGAPGGTSEYDRLKFEFLLKGEIAMNTAAHNLGAAEVELGPQALRELVTSLKAPLISSNVLDDQKQAIVPSHRIVTAGGTKIAVTGLLSRKYARSGIWIDDPVESLLRLTKSLKGQYDQLLVLAYLPEEELEDLVKRVPEADMVVGGPTRQTIAPRRAGPSIWGATTNKGKFLVSLNRPTAGAPWEGSIVELNDAIADDDTQTQNLKRFRRELARIDFTADQTSFAPKLPGELPDDYQVAGSESCVKCHANDCTAWVGTKHGHAWQTLLDKESQMDPYCQHCHTTGYGLPGGFRSIAASAARVNVGCESCHGPAQAHVNTPTVHTLYDARDRCLQCHDHENSPQFKYDDFWSQITHGEPATPASGK